MHVTGGVGPSLRGQVPTAQTPDFAPFLLYSMRFFGGTSLAVVTLQVAFMPHDERLRPEGSPP